MSACEKCWGDAYRRMMMLGGSQTEHYYALLEERKDNPCTPEEQRGDNTPAEDGYYLVTYKSGSVPEEK